jgi:hypothetical protein
VEQLFAGQRRQLQRLLQRPDGVFEGEVEVFEVLGGERVTE